MTFKILDFNTALVTGGAGGIGYAISEYFLSVGKQVIIVGRTESKLKDAASKLGKGTKYYVLDTGDTKSISSFIKKTLADHPDLDCLVNNAGVQRPLDVNEMKPDEFLEKADQEISINISGPMHLTLGLLPHFKSKKGAVIMNVSSVLGYLPSSIINPVYNGTKAWTHFWSMNLRTQLQKDGGSVRVVEIAPPTVSTDLHREREDPDDNKKEKNQAALGVGEFMESITKQWEEDREVVSAGSGQGLTDRWYGEFGEEYGKAAEEFVGK
ncbi:hypothetical protein DOTSEDRAFT_84391 [Dothistroma septosporum NZE10]|uniref:Uncharacterized protein n=1 Tax=Dothistroma septosporum (strain NZE10 / CBS 128990) TaxID=675120 RepID=N1Q310_DOTSN|nr:hypothetical protein DOTSEDRAFT_84391 [Dothistroma septosporum NZE10]